MDDIHGAVEVYGKRVFWITIAGLLIGIIGSIYLAGSIKKNDVWYGARRNFIFI